MSPDDVLSRLKLVNAECLALGVVHLPPPERSKRHAAIMRKHGLTILDALLVLQNEHSYCINVYRWCSDKVK